MSDRRVRGAEVAKSVNGEIGHVAVAAALETAAPIWRGLRDLRAWYRRRYWRRCYRWGRSCGGLDEIAVIWVDHHRRRRRLRSRGTSSRKGRYRGTDPSESPGRLPSSCGDQSSQSSPLVDRVLDDSGHPSLRSLDHREVSSRLRREQLDELLIALLLSHWLLPLTNFGIL
jgi:hypothetical protein